LLLFSWQFPPERMLERGLLPDFALQALAELDGILGAAPLAEEATRDLRNLRWS